MNTEGKSLNKNKIGQNGKKLTFENFRASLKIPYKWASSELKIQ
jgi:hypothetical protein